MKFIIKKNVLLEKLYDVSKAISSKNIIPILSGIKFELNKEKLILTASDNDITIETFIKKEKDILDIITTGSTIIKGKYILDIIKKLDSDFINFEIFEDNKILIYTENSEFNLNGISIKEYPIINLDLMKDPINIKESKLKQLINQTIYASSTDESRVALTGLNFKIDKNILECTATDSYRLSLIKEQITTTDSYNIIIPSKNLFELSKLLRDDDTEVELHLFKNKIMFKFKNLIFQSRLIEDEYPKTSNLIPDDILFSIRLNKLTFFDIIDRASILNSDKDNNTVTLEIKDNLLKVTSVSLEIGKVEEKLNVLCDNQIKISFSSRYMLDALKTITTEDVIICFVGEVKPIILKEENNENLIQLISAIRTY